MDYKALQEFIRAIARSGATEVHIEQGDLKLTVITQKGGTVETIVQQPVVYQQSVQPMPIQQAPVQQVSTPVQQNAAPQQPAASKADDSKYIAVTSPMVGTFYRKSGPDKPPFVNVGDEVSVGKVLCIIEAMKLFNEIECEVSGRIAKILVEDASPVEFGQTLFLVEPK